jgi:hypothetical protein
MISTAYSTFTSADVKRARALSYLKQLMSDQYHYSAYENQHGCGVDKEDLLDMCSGPKGLRMHPNICFVEFKAVCKNAAQLCSVSTSELGTYCKLVEKKSQSFCSEHIQALHNKKCGSRSLSDLLEILV